MQGSPILEGGKQPKKQPKKPVKPAKKPVKPAKKR